MAETSAIEWTDGTVNFWWGCTKVGPGCDNCYAEDWNAFRGNGVWGPGAPRRIIKGATALLRSINRGSALFQAEHGRRPRVFMQSMSDLFDNEVDEEIRLHAFAEAEAATGVNIQFLTKRVSNVAKMVPASWKERWPSHIGLMVTVVNQKEAERDIVRLLELKKLFNIPWVGISVEPMIEPISLRRLHLGGGLYLDAITGKHSREERGIRVTARKDPFYIAGRVVPEALPTLDQVIVGGERAGANSRPMHPAWVEQIQRDCAALPSRTAFFFKQWGDWCPDTELSAAVRETFTKRRVEKMELHRDPNPFASVRLDTMTMYRVGKKDAGRTLGGKIYSAFPKELL